MKHHGLVWFVWFDLGLRALNFITVTQCPIWVYYQGGHRAARAAKKVFVKYFNKVGGLRPGVSQKSVMDRMDSGH